MSENKIRIEDHSGNIYYPHTKSDVVFMKNRKSVEVEIVSHKADIVTDLNGVHGLKIEEGIWSPVLNAYGTNVPSTYKTQQGYYYKIGNQVHIEFYLEVLQKNESLAGTIYISGLPFVTKNPWMPSVNITSVKNITIPTDKQLNALCANNVIEFRKNEGFLNIDVQEIGNLVIFASADYITN
ncbi:hypothetical protein [Crassaminicella profunda]|uniref:hypothetical protein n=1 Tax=Crassaminicella profunda TaxID=1286698 RepID=UPI001CA749D6|nr:hypothetical protein [Crassaminicella profunda]QZY55105.1 hypothetical protein K7H06_19215 [Crassaminicella profunda]